MAWIWDIEIEATREFHLIGELLQPNHRIIPTVNSIVKLTCDAVLADANGDSEALTRHLLPTLGSVLELAARTPPDKQQPLIDFLLQLRQWEIPDVTNETQLRHGEYYDARVWTDLPMLGITVRDLCDGDISFDPAASTDQQQRSENRIAFLAQLWTSFPAEMLENVDFAVYSLWTFREAFEGGLEPIATSQAALRGACLWMIYAADRLWSNVVRDRSFGPSHLHRVASVGTSSLSSKQKKQLERTISAQHWNGFNRARWDRWIAGIQLCRETPTDGTTTAMVERALEEVDRVMDQSWRIREPERYA